MKQGSKRYALTKQQQSIYYNLPLTWQERQRKERKDRLYKKLTNYCFAVEFAVLIAILWLIVPSAIDSIF